jgi:hypothetical protein
MTKKMDAGAAGSAKVSGPGQSEASGRGEGRGSGVRRGLALAALFAAGLSLTGSAGAQQKLGGAPPVTYDNKYEVYGSLNFMNFQAGQNLPKRMNLGGGEFLGTYWLKGKWGLGAEYRGEAGTTPVFPAADVFDIHRPLVYMNMGLAGMQYRGPKNQYAAINYHAYGGLSHGVFDAGTSGGGMFNPYTAAQNAQVAGLYSNRTSPIFALGGSLDLNRSKNWALRLSPDLILEHFGTETREFFAISGGIVYRIPNKKKKK